MRVLVVNHHLSDRAGSELATVEIASVLAARGHEVRLFALWLGPFAEVVSTESGLPVLTRSDADEILAFLPDVIHAHHWPTVVWLRHIGLSAPIVMGFLGTIPPLENPPPLAPGVVVPWWAISEEVAGNVESIDSWRSAPHEVIHNWYDDRGGRPPETTGPTALRRVLVVSNRFPPEARTVIDRVCGELGVDITYVGLPDRPQPVDSRLILSHDAVISLGRTAILAMAWGVPVLILDHVGADGWVTPSNREELGHSNFSGRARRLPITEQAVRTWLLSPPSLEERLELQRFFAVGAGLSAIAARLEHLFEIALRSPQPSLFGPWAGVVIEYLDRVQLQEQFGATSEAATRIFEDELNTQRALLSDAHAREQAIHERLLEAQRREREVEVSLEEVEVSLEQVEARLASIEGSRLWRSANWYRHLRARLAAGRRHPPAP